MSNGDKPTQDNGRGHHGSIRKRLAGTVLVPSIALLLLWVGMSAYFVVDAFSLRAVGSSVQRVSIPAITSLSRLQQERQLSLVYLEKQWVGLLELQQQHQRVDDSIATLREAMDEIRDDLPEEIASRIGDLERGLARLPDVRSGINLRTSSPEEVNEYYNGLIDTATRLFDTQARLVPDVEATQNGLMATELFRASDHMSRAASLASTAFAHGNFTSTDHRMFSELVGSYRSILSAAAPNLLPDTRRSYDELVSAERWEALQRVENELIAHGPGHLDVAGFSLTGVELRDLTNQVSNDLASLTITQADRTASEALEGASSNLTNVLLGSALTLLAALASILVAFRVSNTLVDRTLMTRLERLRNDSLELASTRLPNIVKRLKDGEAVDVNAELPRLDHGRDEIGQVAEAFNLAQLTAVNAAVSEAKARKGVNNVFLGIAHRNQGLVHRQLQILDRMESREENPAQLKSLFQLDNLATRARRTTENLIILGGKQPGRRWRKPVKLLDVLRAAISETEHFSRVEVEPVPDVALVGSAVADTIHLVAELVDNATTFSPPGSPVYLSGTKVARGVIIDIADQGLGMKDEVREWANSMMAEPPEFDAMAMKADSSLGLFVVARLAHRLGAKVTFDSSRYGGTRATVLLPTDVLASEEQATDTDSGFHAMLAKTPELKVHDPAVTTPEQEAAAAATQASPNPMSAPEQPTHQSPAHAPRFESAVPVNGSSPTTPTSRPGEAGTAPVREEEPSATAGVSETPAGGLPRRKGGRALLPKRRPQENLVEQLRNDPESAHSDFERYADRTRNTLTAFHRGTRRGRDADDASRSTEAN